MPPRDHAQLAVYLVVGQAVDHPAACVLQHLGIVDIVLLVKAGAQLQQAEHVLAAVGGIGQSRRDSAAAGHPVERNLEGQDLRIVRRLVDQVHKAQHALEGVAQQQVILLNIGKVLALFQPDIPCRTALLIVQRGVAANAGPEREIEGHALGENAVLRHPELFDQQRPGRIAELAVDADANGHLALALGQHRRDLMAEVLIGPILNVFQEHVGVSRYFHDSGLQHRFLLQQQRQEVAHQLGGQHDLLPAIHLEAQVGRNAVQRDDAELLNAAAAQKGNDVCLAVPEEGQPLADVDELRKQQVAEIAEKLFAHQLVHLVDLLEVQDVHLVCAQLLADGLPDALHQRLLLPGDPQDLSDLGVRQHAGERIGLVRSQEGAVGQDADPHAIELREVRLVDHQKLQAFEQRHCGICRLQQHALIEGQPAQLTVDVNALRHSRGRDFCLFVLGSHNGSVLVC